MAEVVPRTVHHRAGASFRSDLGLELYRQHTLLSIMAARMEESADALARIRRIDPVRIRRALDVHQGYLIDVHHQNEQRVQEALAVVTDPKVQKALQECRTEHPKANVFQAEATRLLTETTKSAEERAAELAALFRREASWIDEHHAKEEQQLYRNLDRWLSKETLAGLLREIRQFDNRRINAEIALSAWASELHPSSD